MKGVSRFWDISALDSSGYQQLNVHINRSCRAASRKRATHVQEPVVLTELQQTDKQYTMSAKVEHCAQRVVHPMFFKYITEGGGLEESMWNVFLHEIVRLLLVQIYKYREAKM